MRTKRTAKNRFSSVVLSVALIFGATQLSGPWEPNTFNPNAEDALAALINTEHRRLCGNNLFRSYQLNKISRWRSQDMILRNYFSHTILGTDKKVFSYFSAYGIRDWLAAGEILSWNNYPVEVSTEFAFKQFMGSAGHRALIQSCTYNAFGVGAYRGSDGRMMYTVVFSKQMVRRVVVTVLNLRTGPGTQYAVKARLYYGNKILVFNHKNDKYGRRWYYGNTSKGWGWVAGWRTK